MPTPILDGLSLVDATGRIILATTVSALLAAVAAHGFLRARYAALERDLLQNAEPRPHFSHPVLARVVREAEEAARLSGERNTQAVIEECFHGELRPLLLAERFVRASTGLVIILGLLGTFYGLTLSIGKLVHLVAAPDTGVTADVAQAVTHGLTEALAGMAVAFSNSLVGILSAVVLTVLGVVSNVTDRRTALMIQLETYLDRLLPEPGNRSARRRDSRRRFRRVGRSARGRRRALRVRPAALRGEHEGPSRSPPGRGAQAQRRTLSRRTRAKPTPSPFRPRGNARNLARVHRRDVDLVPHPVRPRPPRVRAELDERQASRGVSTADRRVRAAAPGAALGDPDRKDRAGKLRDETPRAASRCRRHQPDGRHAALPVAEHRRAARRSADQAQASHRSPARSEQRRRRRDREDRRQRQHRDQRESGVRIQLVRRQEGREAAARYAREGARQRPCGRRCPREHRHDL